MLPLEELLEEEDVEEDSELVVGAGFADVVGVGVLLVLAF